MKKNRSMRTSGMLAVLVMVTASIIAGTLAKYTTSVEATGSATVAKFDVGFKTRDDSTTFDLLETVYDTEAVDGTKYKGEAETNTGTAKLLAPGEYGCFDFKVENKSEVDVKYKINLTQESNNGTEATKIPIEYQVTDSAATHPLVADSAWTTDLTAVDVSGVLGYVGNTTSGIATGEQTTKTVWWRWKYETGADATAIAAHDKDVDTKLGEQAQTTAPELKLKATAVFTQID